MNTTKYIDIFVSHRWKYNQDYYALLQNLIKTSERTIYTIRDYSVPEHDPYDLDGKKLWAKIVEHIRQSSVFIVFNGMYINYSNFMDLEIAAAVKMQKPILIIKHWDSERTPKQLNDLVNEGKAVFIGWNSVPVYNKIKELSGL